MYRLISVFYSVLVLYLLPRNQRITDKTACVKVFSVHIDRRNLMIFIGRVVVNTFACVTAGGVKRDFIFFVADVTAAPLLVYRA